MAKWLKSGGVGEVTSSMTHLLLNIIKNITLKNRPFSFSLGSVEKRRVYLRSLLCWLVCEQLVAVLHSCCFIQLWLVCFRFNFRFGTPVGLQNWVSFFWGWGVLMGVSPMIELHTIFVYLYSPIEGRGNLL